MATANTTAAITNASVASNSDTVSVPAVQNPAISLTKTVLVVSPSDYTAGREVTYIYTVQNTGDVQFLAAS